MSSSRARPPRFCRKPTMQSFVRMVRRQLRPANCGAVLDFYRTPHPHAGVAWSPAQQRQSPQQMFQREPLLERCLRLKYDFSTGSVLWTFLAANMDGDSKGSHLETALVGYFHRAVQTHSGQTLDAYFQSLRGIQTKSPPQTSLLHRILIPSFVHFDRHASLSTQWFNPAASFLVQPPKEMGPDVFWSIGVVASCKCQNRNTSEESLRSVHPPHIFSQAKKKGLEFIAARDVYESLLPTDFGFVR